MSQIWCRSGGAIGTVLNRSRRSGWGSLMLPIVGVCLTSEENGDNPRTGQSQRLQAPAGDRRSRFLLRRTYPPFRRTSRKDVILQSETAEASLFRRTEKARQGVVTLAVRLCPGERRSNGLQLSSAQETAM